MKKITILFAAVVAALFFCSCNKEDSINDGKIKIVCEIAGTKGPATKAIKNCFEYGDKINIWFDDHVSELPDLIIPIQKTAGLVNWMIRQ